MWAETEKPQDTSREVKGVTEVQADDQTVAQREERKEIANENQENDFKANEAVVPAISPVVNEVVTEDSEYVGKGAMSYR